MALFWAFLPAFVITALAVVVLRPLAKVVDLIDRPGGRKTHHGEVPVVGGLAMFVGVVIGIGLISRGNVTFGVLTAGFGLLVLVGMFDDRFGLPAWIRLPTHLAVAYLLVVSASCRVVTLGDPFALGVVNFHGAWMVVSSVILIASAVNAFNMLDGLDGLAGTTAAVAITALGYVAWRMGDVGTASICAVMFGAICGFLLFNLPVRENRPLRCFMGDAGSTLLGVAVAWVMVQVSQSPNSASTMGISPVTALWIGGLPVIELIWSFLRRVARGRSPFLADAEHFHHILVKAGYSVRGSFAVLLVIASALAIAGLALDAVRAADYVSLLSLAVVGIFVVRSIYLAGRLLPYLPRGSRRPQLQE
jgi:UDP-GlcNAc:undecaprenyl-phosphate GlcNAc-1-phosphate transferase